MQNLFQLLKQMEQKRSGSYVAVLRLNVYHHLVSEIRNLMFQCGTLLFVSLLRLQDSVLQSFLPFRL